MVTPVVRIESAGGRGRIGDSLGTSLSWYDMALKDGEAT